MIEFVEATKIYSLKNEKTVFALNGVNTVISNIGMISILGKSGSGKTTFLNMLGGLDSLTSGYIKYNGRRMDEFSTSDFDEFRNEHIAYVFQEYNLISEYNVLENIKIALRFQSDCEKEIHKKALEVLREVGLEGYENRKISELSGGQQQRVAIARAIAKQARVFLCDEPTGNLDSETTNEIMILLKRISKKRLVIIVTHDRELAYEYSDKILQIADGKLVNEINVVTEDNTKVNESLMSNSEMVTDDSVINRSSLSVKNIIKYALSNIKKGLIVSIIVVMLLVISFTLLISFYSLSNFDQNKAIYNTLTVNGTKVIPITRYIDKVYMLPDEETYSYGPSIECESVYEEDYSKILEKLGTDVTIYKSYFFNKYFSDFVNYNSEFKTTVFKSNCFSEFVAVCDFEKFNITLYAGEYPKYNNEVVIYDYMAYNMMTYGNFNNIENINDFIGYELIDKNTGFCMKIVGLLKSNYEDYMYVEEKMGNYNFEASYLASLQSVFGMQSFLENIKQESKWYSTNGLYLYLDDEKLEDKRISEKIIKPLVMIDDVSEFEFIGEFNPYDDFMGIILSNKQVARLCNIEVEQIDEKYVYENIGVLFTEINSILFTKAIEKSYPFDSLVGVIGIYIGDDTEDIYCFQKGSLETKWFIENGQFKQFYLSLDENYNKSLELISVLQAKKMSEDFYLSNLNYYCEGFMIYTPYLYMIEEANIYLSSVQKLGERLTVLSVCLLVTGIVVYGFLSIKKNKYKIGIFKSLGARNRDITIIFGAEFIVIIFIAVIASVFCAKGLVNVINNDFVKELQYRVVFFKVLAKDYMYPIFVGLTISFVSMIVPLIKIFCTSPITIIKSSRK